MSQPLTCRKCGREIRATPRPVGTGFGHVDHLTRGHPAKPKEPQPCGDGSSPTTARQVATGSPE